MRNAYDHRLPLTLYECQVGNNSKLCPKCGLTKPLEEFSSRNLQNYKPVSYCRSCQRNYCKKHYERLKTVHNVRRYERQQRARSVNRRFVDSYLQQHPCADCGEHDIRVLEFDHVRGKKLDSISEMIYQASFSRLSSELQKCEVRCANCHRRKTARQFRWRASQ